MTCRARGPLPDVDCPTAGWTRFGQKDEGLDWEAVQHADKSDLREVLDPNYVDGGYGYVIRSDDGSGWNSRRKATLRGMTNEDFDFDPEQSVGPTTPR